MAVRDALQKEYGDSDRLVNFLHRRLSDLKPANTPTEIRVFVDNAEAIMRQLQALGHDVESDVARPMIMRTLEAKLTPALLNQLYVFRASTRDTSAPWQVFDFCNTLRNWLRSNDRIFELFPSSGASSKPDGTSVPTSAFAVGTSTSATKNSNNTQKQANTPKCSFCAQAHWSNQCDKYKHAPARLQYCKDHNMCIKCLRPGHSMRQCTVTKKSCFHCSRAHNSALCFQKFPDPHAAARPQNSAQKPAAAPTPTQAANTVVSQFAIEALVPTNEAPSAPIQETAVLCTQQPAAMNHSVRLMTATTISLNPENTSRSRPTRLFLDGGSQSSFVSANVADKLGLVRSPPIQLRLNTFTDQGCAEIETALVEIMLHLKGDNPPLKIRCYVIPRDFISQLAHQPALSLEDRVFVFTKSITELAESNIDTTTPIDMLVGLDYYFDIVDMSSYQELPSGLRLVQSKLGWIIAGRMNHHDHDTHMQHANITTYAIDVQPSVAPQSDMEIIEGDVTSDVSPLSFEDTSLTDCPPVPDLHTDNDDEDAVRQFNETVCIRNGRIAVAWPWTSPRMPLPPNYNLSYAMLKSVMKGLESKPDLKQKYCAIMSEQKSQGVVETIDPSSDTAETHPHYLPHHGIYRADKGKLRCVFNGSAKTSALGVSLNDLLLRGPVNLPNVASLLAYFRLSSTVLCCDIQSAYLQLELLPQSRDVVRFLWVRDPDQPVTPENIQVMRFCRVPFGIMSSGFLLEHALKYALSRETHPYAALISRHLYVDNICVDLPNDLALRTFYEQAKGMFHKWGMNLREFVTSDPEFNRSLPPADSTPGDTFKIMGIPWNHQEDTISFPTPHPSPTKSVSKAIEQGHVTKRIITSVLASLYDPLGLLLPAKVPAKVLAQSLTQDKYDWDTPVPESIASTWHTLQRELMDAAAITIPRRIHRPPDAPFTLEVFVDSSKTAFAAVAYIRFEYPENRFHTKILAARSHLCPCSQAISIPRLELMAAVLGSDLTDSLLTTDIFPDTPWRCHIWSDSQIVLNWLTTTRTLCRFVQNRISKLRDKPYTFRYIETRLNPADYGTRQATAAELSSPAHIWWTGPRFLRKSMDFWPTYNLEPIDPYALEVAAKHRAERTTPVHLSVNPVQAVPVPPPGPFDPARHSSLLKLQRTTSIWLRFLKHSIYNQLPDDTQRKLGLLHKYCTHIKSHGPLTANEISVASILLNKQCQTLHFGHTLNQLIRNEQNHLIRSLRLQLDSNNVIRSLHRHEHMAQTAGSGRAEAGLILMPTKSDYTNLLIMHCHTENKHSGMQQTLHSLREQFWVPKGRAAVKSAINKCLPCKRYFGGAFVLPRFPALPPSRVRPSPAFKHCGVDLAGPFTVRDENGQLAKRLLALFCCLSTRNIHLEVMLSASSNHFMYALRAFMARRGVPQELVSDQGTQLMHTINVLQEHWVAQDLDITLLSYCATHNITYTVATPAAPWQRGFIEVLIGLSKKALKTTIGARLITTEQLRVYAAEAESIVNARPISYIYSDRQSFQAIRPMDLISPTRPFGWSSWPHEPTDTDYVTAPQSRQQLADQWILLQQLIDLFWNKWQKEYLTNLRQNMPNEHPHKRGSDRRFPIVDEVVIVNDFPAPRATWKLGRITELPPTSCERSHSAKVRLADGKTLHRPINLLHPLEPLPPGPDTPVAPPTALILPRRTPGDPNLSIEAPYDDADVFRSWFDSN